MPYIGYFQLIHSVDEFVVYDNIQYTKKGWINRNRILVDARDSYITLPLKADSDYLDIRERSLALTWPRERSKMLNRIRMAYRKAPHFDPVYAVIEKIILHENDNLFGFILNSLTVINEHLEITTPLLVSSEIPIDHKLRSEAKVLEICAARKADTYLNPIGGVALYGRADFERKGVTLRFLQTRDFQYAQFCGEFIPFLSIIDVMMFNSLNVIKDYLSTFFTLQ